jgi:hypothetical protein
MHELELARRLKILKRSVLMLETELRHEHLDDELLDGIDRQLEEGIAADERSAVLRDHVDKLRESVMTPRTELYRDAVRSCEKLKDQIEAVLARLG